MHRAGILAVLWLTGAVSVAAQSLDGNWRSEGYGLYIEVSGPTLKAFEVTAISCLPSFSAQRSSAESNGDVLFKVVDRPTTFVFRSGTDPDRRLLHMNGAASDIVIRRQRGAPAACSTTTPDTPLSNFDIFTRTWAEQYGFFDIKHVDWPAVVARNRAKVTDRTTATELFQMLKEMIEPLQDAHTSIRAENINQTFS